MSSGSRGRPLTTERAITSSASVLVRPRAASAAASRAASVLSRPAESAMPAAMARRSAGSGRPRRITVNSFSSSGGSCRRQPRMTTARDEQRAWRSCSRRVRESTGSAGCPASPRNCWKSRSTRMLFSGSSLRLSTACSGSLTGSAPPVATCTRPPVTLQTWRLQPRSAAVRASRASARTSSKVTRQIPAKPARM